MRAIRLHTDRLLAIGETVQLEPGPARHLIKVLRRRPGDAVLLFNGDGADYAGEIVDARPPEHCQVRINELIPIETESPLMITLAQALARGERMDYAIQKAVELGVAAIRPIISERTEVQLQGERIERRMKHWRQLIASACEQCGRASLPPIHEPVRLAALASGPGLNLFLDPLAEASLAGLPRPEPAAAQLVIGPEGGLAAAELDALRARGFQGLRLGPRVLRTETAGAAAIAVLQARYGDLG